MRFRPTLPNTIATAASLCMAFVAGCLFANAANGATGDVERLPPIESYVDRTIMTTDVFETGRQSRIDESFEPAVFSAYWDNDWEHINLVDPSDRQYTNGMGFSVAHRPAWADGLARIMPIGRRWWQDRNPVTGAGVVVGQLMFTPDDISTTTVISDDRPHAGYLFGGLFWERRDENATTLERFRIDLGTIGPSAGAGDVQSSIHATFEDETPQGWGNQLRDEFTAQFYYRKRWRYRFDPWQTILLPTGEFIPGAALAAGTVHRHLEGDVLVRVGYNLGDEFGPGRLFDVKTATAGQNRGVSLYAFGRAGGRIVEHNVFLEGNNFATSHAVQPRSLVGEVQWGIVLALESARWTISASWSTVHLSPEFVTQQGGQSYASVAAAVTYRMP